MATLRTITCDIEGCDEQFTEPSPGAGWQGWGALHGIVLNGIENPTFCPSCLEKVAVFIDEELCDGVD